MSDFDINIKPWIDYGIGDKENNIKQKMTDLVSMSWSPFNESDRAQVFIFCMSYAFAKGRIPKDLPKSGGGSLPASAFKKDMRDYMKVVAIVHTNSLDIITKPVEVVNICEKYAYAGFLEVYDKIKNRNSSITNEMIMESLLNEIESERTPDS